MNTYVSVRFMPYELVEIEVLQNLSCKKPEVPIKKFILDSEPKTL